MNILLKFISLFFILNILDFKISNGINVEFNLSYINQCTNYKSPCDLKTSQAWTPELPTDGDDVVIDIRNAPNTGNYYYFSINDLDVVFNSLTLNGAITSTANYLKLDISNSNINTTNQFQIISSSVFFSNSINSYGSISMSGSSFISLPSSYLTLTNLEIDQSSNINMTNSNLYLYGTINGQSTFENEFITFYNSTLNFPSGFTFNNISNWSKIEDMVQSTIKIMDNNKVTTIQNCIKAMVSFNSPGSLTLFNSTLNYASSNGLYVNSTSSINQLYSSGLVYINHEAVFLIYQATTVLSNITVDGSLIAYGPFISQYLYSTPNGYIDLNSSTVNAEIIGYDTEFDIPTLLNSSMSIIENGTLLLMRNTNLTIRGGFSMYKYSTLYLFYDFDNYENSTSFYKTPLITVNGSINIQQDTNLVIRFNSNGQLESNFSITLIKGIGSGSDIDVTNVFNSITIYQAHSGDGELKVISDGQTIQLVLSNGQNVKKFDLSKYLKVIIIIFSFIIAIVIFCFVVRRIIHIRRRHHHHHDQNEYSTLLNKSIDK